MRSSSSLSGPTYLLVIIATLMLQINLYDRQGLTPQEWIHLAFVVVVAIALRYKNRVGSESTGRLIDGVGFAALVLAPFALDMFGRQTGRFGNPYEIQITLMLRNMMIGLAVATDDSRSKTFAALASCFLALFSLMWLMNYWIIALLIAYTITGMWWLLGAYWDRLSDCFLTHSERAIPWKPAICATAITGLITLLMLPLINDQYYTTAIQGFMPSSGGTGSQDEYAYGGVGDGPQMVSAKDNASSFGPIESELFLESKMPSLYDVVNEFSDPPPKPINKKRIRAIPLAPGQMQENHQRRGTTQQAGREFSAVRNRKEESSSSQDYSSHALLQVAGRVPVHLGLYAYDMWDGHKLTSSDSAKPLPMRLVTDESDGRRWVRYDQVTTQDTPTHKERYEIRVINLKTDRIPSPPNLRGVHIDRIHTKHFFDTALDGMLAIDVDFIPQLTVLHLESSTHWATKLPPLEQRSEDAKTPQNAIRGLARQWTEGVEDGWDQIEAICTRLRQEYTLDPEALVSQDVEDAAEYFLLESKRGPDYLFATSAALLIQSLGYETRVVSGFYANPENYDRQARLTSVYAEDAHFWVEVLAASSVAKPSFYQTGPNRWLTVEPSPGYQVLYAPESIWSLLFQRVAATWKVLRSNPLSAMAMVALVVATWHKKADVIDLAITGWWRLHHRWGDVRHQVRSTLRLLDRRARVRGCPRPSGLSLGRWKLSPHPREAESVGWEAAFLSLADWALYAEGHAICFSRDEVNALCRSAAIHALRPPRKQRQPIFSSVCEEKK